MVNYALDKLVAQRVMGWKVSLDSNNRDHEIMLEDSDGSIWFHNGIVRWHPSGDMGDAWKVVERLDHKSITIQFCKGDETKDKWYAIFFEGTLEHYASTSETAQLSICLAACQAAGVSETELDAAMKGERQ